MLQRTHWGERSPTALLQPVRSSSSRAGGKLLILVNRYCDTGTPLTLAAQVVGAQNDESLPGVAELTQTYRRQICFAIELMVNLQRISSFDVPASQVISKRKASRSPLRGVLERPAEYSRANAFHIIVPLPEGRRLLGGRRLVLAKCLARRSLLARLLGDIGFLFDRGA
jgi:hypothetical protein